MYLGIDFGTCFSSAAYVMNDQIVRVKDSRKLGYSFPSSVFVTESGEILIGHVADFQRNREPQHYQREFKRSLGTTVPVSLRGKAYLPQDLIAEVLRKLKQEADASVKVHDLPEFRSAVITVPATYQGTKRNLMHQAAEVAGFREIEIIDEPIATALYYAQQAAIAPGEILLIYDFGGGTFDASLIQKEANGYRLMAMPMGLEHCGGIDIDRQIFENLYKQGSEELRSKLNPEQREVENLRARFAIADWCREAKHQLSEVTEFEDSPPGFYSDVYQLSRAQLEAIISPIVSQTVDCCQQLLKRAEIQPQNLSRILLVGGSSRIPFVQQVLAKTFQCSVLKTDEPELAICMGAALRGGERQKGHQAAQWISRGMASFVKQDFFRAQGLFEKALTFNSNSALAHLSLGLVSYVQREPRSAVRAFDIAIQQDPSLSFAYLFRAIACLGQVEPELALADLAKAGLNLYPKLALSELTNPTDAVVVREWIETIGQGVVLEMVPIPGGSYLMGSPDGQGEGNEHPQHKVTLSSFYLGKYPVTQSQYEAIMGTNPSKWKGVNLPVEQVTWPEAQEFCEKLSAKTGKPYRLPSEAEWEYACRAGTTTAYNYGDVETHLGVYAWHNGNSGSQTHPVGEKKPNLWGLHDMHGNVWEWCEDVWYDDYSGAPSDGSARKTNSTSESRRLLVQRPEALSLC